MKKLHADMLQHGIQVARGMHQLKDSMIRVGLLGVVDAGKIADFLNAYHKSVGSGIEINKDDVPKGASFDPAILEEIGEAWVI